MNIYTNSTKRPIFSWRGEALLFEIVPMANDVIPYIERCVNCFVLRILTVAIIYDRQGGGKKTEGWTASKKQWR